MSVKKGNGPGICCFSGGLSEETFSEEDFCPAERLVKPGVLLYNMKERKRPKSRILQEDNLEERISNRP